MRFPSGYSLREIQNALLDGKIVIAKRASDGKEFRCLRVVRKFVPEQSVQAIPLGSNGRAAYCISDAWLGR